MKEIKPETLRSQVENVIREAIITGKLMPGERLVERELCETLNVSRTSVREALRKLEAEKLVKIIPHKGPIVPFVSIAEAKEIYAARCLLEGFAAGEFTRIASDEAVELFGKEIKVLSQSIASGKRMDVLASKTRLYQIVSDNCGNSIIKEILKGLHSRISVLRITSMLHPNRVEKTLLEMERLYKAFKTRNANQAEKEAKKHVNNAEKIALKILKEKLAE